MQIEFNAFTNLIKFINTSYTTIERFINERG